MSAWSYATAIEGMPRCCIASVDEQMGVWLEDGRDAPHEGERLQTECCDRPVVFRDGAWRWDPTQEPA